MSVGAHAAPTTRARLCDSLSHRHHLSDSPPTRLRRRLSWPATPGWPRCRSALCLPKATAPGVPASLARSSLDALVSTPPIVICRCLRKPLPCAAGRNVLTGSVAAQPRWLRPTATKGKLGVAHSHRAAMCERGNGVPHPSTLRPQPSRVLIRAPECTVAVVSEEMAYRGDQRVLTFNRTLPSPRDAEPCPRRRPACLRRIVFVLPSRNVCCTLVSGTWK